MLKYDRRHIPKWSKKKMGLMDYIDNIGDVFKPLAKIKKWKIFLVIVVIVYYLWGR